MAMGARDIMIIMRARDLASREINNVGRAMRGLNGAGQGLAANMMGISAGMIGVGTGLAMVGAAGAGFFVSATRSAMEFNQGMALALTQAKDAGATLEDLKDIGRRVAMTIPAPFEQMDEALYDIFSSVDVNVQQAEGLLAEFSRAAVAGQVDIQEAARGTMAVMNAWQIPAEEVGDILDTQFRMVEKGIGTYSEFAGSLGRAIPAAVRAGQSFETLGGMMVFLTRNGLSTEMAATSAARGLEAMAHPKVVSRLEDMGITVKDAAGNYQSLESIVGQLSGKLKGLPGPERVAVLQELFKGAGGTIQARRFWDMAINNTQAFGRALDWVADRKDSMARAYDIMFEQPQTQIQMFKNAWETLKTTIGDSLLPIIGTIAGAGYILIEWFLGLDKTVRDRIVTIAAFITTVSLISGAIMIIIGTIAGFIAILGLMGVGITGAIAILMGIPIVVGIIVAAIWHLIQNWSTLGPTLLGYWNDFVTGFRLGGDDLGAAIMTQLGGFRAFGANVRQIWETIKEYWNTFVAWAKLLWATFLTELKAFWEKWGPDIIAFFQKTWDQIKGVFQSAIDVIKAFWAKWGEDIIRIGGALWGRLKIAIEQAWIGIKQIVDGALRIIKGIFDVFAGLFTGDWSRLWGGIKGIFSGIWSAILGIGRVMAAALGAVFALAWAKIELIFRVAGGILADIFSAIWRGITTKASDAWQGIKNIFKGAGDWFMSLGTDMINGLIRGIKNMAGAVASAARGVVTDAMNAAKKLLRIGSPSKTMADMIGSPMMQGVSVGILDEARAAQEVMRSAMSSLVVAPPTQPAPAFAPVVSSQGTGVTVSEGAVQLIIQGNVTEDAMADVQAAIDEAFYRLTLELRRG